MPDYERRFKGFTQEEIARCVAELEAQARGARALSTEEIEELLGLLPANYFNRVIRRRIRDLFRNQQYLAGQPLDILDAADKIAQECRLQLRRDSI